MKLKTKTIWTKVLEKDQIKMVNDIMKEDIVKLVGYYEGDKVKDTSTKDILLEFIKEQRTFNGSVALFMKDQKEFNNSVNSFMEEQKEFNAEQKEFNKKIEIKVEKIESKVERIEDKVDKNSKSIEKLFNITSNMAEFVGYKIK